MKPHIIDFLKFLKNKENRKIPLVAKLLSPDKFSPLTKEELNIDNLDLSESTIKSLPDNLTIKAYLILTGSEIESLPKNLTVGDFLTLSYTVVDSLPDNLTVGGFLDLESTRIHTIPNNLKVGGSLHVEGTPLAGLMTEDEIRQEIVRKGGYVQGEIIIDDAWLENMHT